jgi:hypothetical protein
MTTTNKRGKDRRSYADVLLNSDSDGEKDALDVLTESSYGSADSPSSNAMDSSPILPFKRRQTKKRRNVTLTTKDNAEAEDDAIPIPGNRLFVGGVPLKLREKDLTKCFAEFGEVKHAIVHKNKDGTSKVLHSLLLPPSLVSYYVTNFVSLTLT